MINGVHALIYAEDAEKVRAFFKDVLGFPSIDAGQGWLLFRLPPAELGFIRQRVTRGATSSI